MIRILSLIGICLLISCGKEDMPPKFSCGEEISLVNDVMPIIDNNCNFPTCHGTGKLPFFTSKDVVIENAEDIRRVVAGGFMPPSSPLPSDKIDLIKCWVDDGAKNN